MKQINFILILILIYTLFPFVATAGIRGMPDTTQGECYIGSIETSHTVTERRVTFDATIYIRDSKRKPVQGTKVEGAWRSKKGVVTSGRCTTGEDGKCSIPHVVRAKHGEKITVPQRGIRIIGVNCPDLKYIYIDNTTFAWATTN